MKQYIRLLRDYGIGLAMEAGSQAAGNLVNEAMGLAFQVPKNKQQLKQARRLQDLSLEGEATRLERNKKYALEMWEATGYGAQVDQMKRAGINPALLYGMSGGGGQTANVPAAATTQGNAGTAQATRGSEGMGLMIGQLGLLEAQRKNIEADTKLKETQAGESGVRTDIGHLELQFKKDSYEDNLDIIRAQFSNLQEDANRKNRENRVGDKTETDQVAKIQQEAIEAYLKNYLIGAQTANTEASTEETKQRIKQSEAEINKWAIEIQQKWKELDLKGKEMLIRQYEAELKGKYPGLMNVIGGAVNDVVEGVNEVVGGERKDKPIWK